MAPADLPTFWGGLADFTVRRARLILAVVGAATLSFLYFLLQIEVDTDLDAFIRPEARELVDTIRDDFDEGGVLILTFESRSDLSLLAPELLHQQLRIIQAIKRSYKVTTYSLVEGIDQGLKRIKNKSLLDYQEYSPIAEAILGLAGGRTVRDLEKVSRHFLSHPEAIAFYVKLRMATRLAPMGQPAGARETTYKVPFVKAIKAHVRLDAGYSGQERKQALASIRDLAQSLATPPLKVYALNDQLMSHELDLRSRENGILLGLMVFLVDSLCVWALFRSRRELFLVLSILATACIWTYGAASLLGFRFSFFHLVSIPILLGTGIDDTFIFARRLAEERSKGSQFPEALRATFKGVGTAIFLTTFTTLLAFLITALTATTEIVFSFYMLVSISMLIVFLLSTFLQGALRAELVRWGPWVPEPDSTTSHFLLESSARGLAGLSCRMMNHPRPILLVSGLLMVVALGSATTLKSEMLREDFMDPRMQTYAAREASTKYFGDTRLGYVLFTGEVENPVLLEKMRRLQERLTNYPMIDQVLRKADVDSVIELIDKLGITITPETPVRSVFDRIAQNERTANYVLDLTYREAAEHVMRKNGDRYDGLLMRFFARGEESSQVVAAYRAIERELKELEFDRIPGVEIRIGAGDIVYSLETVYFLELLVRSFFLSLIANWLVLLVVWRRVRPAILAMAPLVLAVSLVFGLMAVCGIRLTLVNVAIGGIAVGLGIDYPIHIIERFREEARRRRDLRRQAAERALVTMGPHILASMLTTVVGFGAACVLALPLTVSFGLLTAGAIGLIYLASIFVLPTLLARSGSPPVQAPNKLSWP